MFLAVGDENKEVKEEAGKVVKKEKVESTPFGELTQRLVQGLMEENLMTQVDDTTMIGKEDDIGSKNSFIHSLKVANGDSLEARLKKELEEQGILEAGEEEDGGPDEILSELTRCQEELKAVAQHNQAQLRRLAKSAREEMARQEIRERWEGLGDQTDIIYLYLCSGSVWLTRKSARLIRKLR